MSFETIRRQSPGFPTFVLNRLMSREKFLSTGRTFSACDVMDNFSGMSRETARDVGTTSALV